MRARPVTEPAAAARSASPARPARGAPRVLHEHERRVGEPDAAAGALEQRTPASRSRIASCWETADGVNCSASATAAIVPRSCSSWRRRSRRRSSIQERCYCFCTRNPNRSLTARSDGPCPPPEPSVSPPPPRSARWRCSASSPTTRARRWARCSRPLRARRGAVLAAPPRRRRGAGAPAPDARDAARPRAGRRLARAGRRYFAALERIDASLLSLLVYTFPVIVTVAAIALGREGRRPPVALALASGGLVLVLAGAGQALDPLGAALGLGRSVCTAPTSSSASAPRRVRPLVLGGARLHRRGAGLALTLARRADPGRPHHRRLGLARRRWR